MKVIKSLLLCSAVFFSLLGCEENNTYKARLKDPQLFHNSMQALSDVIVYDIFSPPVASRVYMYPTIAAYAVMQKQYPKKYEDMAGQLSDFKTIPEINDPDIHAELAAIHAFSQSCIIVQRTARRLYIQIHIYKYIYTNTYIQIQDYTKNDHPKMFSGYGGQSPYPVIHV